MNLILAFCYFQWSYLNLNHQKHPLCKQLLLLLQSVIISLIFQ